MPNPLTYTNTVTSIKYEWNKPWSNGGSAYVFNLSAATLAETFGTKIATFVKNLSGYNPNQVLMAQSICADDVNAPIYLNNIGQQPTTLQSFLGPFMAGGIGGYPFAGPTGLFAWASHITQDGALYLNVMTHLGVSLSGDVGYVRRRGQNGSLSNTCGAVGAAVGFVALSSNAVSPQLLSSNFISTSGFQQWFLTNTIWSARPSLTASAINRITPLTSSASATSAQMIVATKTVLNAASGIIETILPIGYSAYFTTSSIPVFVTYGTFINVDDGYDAYINVDAVKKYTPFGWEDYTKYFYSL